MKTLPAFVCGLILCMPAYGQSTETLLLQTSEVHPLMARFDADEGSLERFYFVTNSPERRERLKTLYNDYLSRLNALDYFRLS